MRTTGTVKWFNDAKGFGFITPEGGQKENVVKLGRYDRSPRTRPARGHPGRPSCLSSHPTSAPTAIRPSSSTSPKLPPPHCAFIASRRP
jgi:hypothetical protein